ncbi:MAG: UDP-N-acetylmuramoyl-tripeptide--D-alanyl-D-alanine ligase [Pirellulaceae bacterium]|nr:UDP-N-acetylmuramoyl-tripeptide--D-alanyl-D-alanine ligase [Pirellulaceae bacterium]
MRDVLAYLDLGLRYRGRLDAFLRHRLDRCYPLPRTLAAMYRRWGIPRKQLITVIGSLGKSTTTRALRAVLLEKDHYQSFSNYGSRLAENLLRSPYWQRCDVLEVGISGPGQMRDYARMIRPDVVVVTSIASDHNRSLPTLEQTREEKAEMVRALPSAGLAVLNADDPHVIWMASQTRARVLRYGLRPDCDVWAADLQLNWPTGMAFTLHAGGESVRVQSRLLGGHLVYPLLAAAAVAWQEHMPLARVAQRLETVAPVPARLEPHQLPGGAILIDDSYKSGIESFRVAIDLLRQIPARRRIAVIGDIEEPVGSLGPLYRELGERLASSVDLLISLGASNTIGPLRAAATQAGLARSAIHRIAGGVHGAEEFLRANDLSAGDVVLLKGPYAKRLRRLLLRLQGRSVCCSAEDCRVKVPVCDVCPLLDIDTTQLHNPLVTRWLQHRAGDNQIRERAA